VLNVALVVAGCGGGSEDSAASDKELDEVVERVDRELEKSGGAVGLGEASPPPADAGQWKTDFTKRLVPLAEFQAGGRPRTASRRSTSRATRVRTTSSSSRTASQ
jgi:hypothetical protein